MSFEKDLPLGRRFETEVKRVLEEFRFTVKHMQDNFIFYDLEVTREKLRTVECKYDRESKYTQNIAIEYECRDKPSGIQVTTADYWIHYYFDKRWRIAVYPLKDLKKLCEGKPRVPGGDWNQSRVFLIPKNLILPQYNREWNINL